MIDHYSRVSSWLWAIVIGAFILFHIDSIWSWSIDIAHHYVLSFRLSEQWILDSASDPTLGEMNFYPPVSHAFAAVVGQVLGSTFLGIQVTALLAYALLWMFAVLLLTSQPRHESLSALGVFMVMVTVNAFTLQIQVHGNEVVQNFFFAQFVAQALLFGSIFAGLQIERRVGPAPAYLVLFVLMLMIAWTHLLPAVELLALIMGLVALQVVTAYRRGEGVLPSASRFLPIAVISLAGIVFHPTFSAMRQISKNDGFLDLQIIQYPGGLLLLAVLVICLSGLLGFAWFRSGEHRDRLLAKYLAVFGMAVGALCALQFLLTFFGYGSSYAVKKYGFSLSSILLLQISVLAGQYLAFRGPGVPVPRGADRVIPAIALGVVLIATVPAEKSLDVSDLVATERELINVTDTLIPPAAQGRSNVLVGLDSFPGTISYLFSVSILKTPRTDEVLREIVSNDLKDVEPFSYIVTGQRNPAFSGAGCEHSASRSVKILDSLCLQERIAAGSVCKGSFDFSSANSVVRALLSGFGPPREQGRWTVGQQAGFRCRLRGQAPRVLKIEGAPFTHGEHKSQRVQIAVNGEGVFAGRISSHRGSDNPIVIPLHAFSGAQEFTIEFRLPDARSPRELGLNADKRELGFRVRRLSFE